MIMVMKFTRNLALSMVFSAFALGQQVNGPDYDSPTGGPPAKFFAAAASIPVAGLRAAAAKASKVPNLATYPVSLEKNAAKSTIHSDWLSFSEVGSFLCFSIDI